MSGKETSMSLKFLKGCERLNAWDKDFLAFDSGNDSIKSAITWKAFEEGIGSIRRNLSELFAIASPNSSSTSSFNARLAGGAFFYPSEERPNARGQLRAERVRFVTASNRKSVNAKEPSASACYVAIPPDIAITFARSRSEVPKAKSERISKSRETEGSPDSILATRD